MGRVLWMGVQAPRSDRPFSKKTQGTPRIIGNPKSQNRVSALQQYFLPIPYLHSWEEIKNNKKWKLWINYSVRQCLCQGDIREGLNLVPCPHKKDRKGLRVEGEVSPGLPCLTVTRHKFGQLSQLVFFPAVAVVGNSVAIFHPWSRKTEGRLLAPFVRASGAKLYETVSSSTRLD